MTNKSGESMKNVGITGKIVPFVDLSFRELLKLMRHTSYKKKKNFSQLKNLK